jgi:hypothetical protein
MRHDQARDLAHALLAAVGDDDGGGADHESAR